MASSMWTWDVTDDQGEDDELFSSSRDLQSAKDTLIMLVDCSESMFNKIDEFSPFQLSIKCVRSVLLNKIVSSDKDVVGVVLYGTAKHKNPNEFHHVYVLQDLDLPDADRIKQVEDILEGSLDFVSDYGHSNDYSLSDVLWTCSSMLATSPNKNSHKRILLFTNNDNPHSSNPAQQRQARTRFKDLLENGVEVELMPIGSTFQVSRFYQDILFGDAEAPLPDPTEKFEELLMRVRSKEFKKRALQNVQLTLAPGFEIGISVYCLVREAKRPTFVRLDKRTNEELATQTKWLCNDTGTELMSSDIKYYQELGGEKVVFEKEEVDSMKAVSNQGFQLIGFKPLNKMKKHNFIKPGRFIYPNDLDIAGSSKTFSAFLDRCIDKQVVPICCYVSTARAAPRFVALIPQKEELGDGNTQITPPGFHVMYLPFTEDIRNISHESTTKATTQQIDKAKDVIKKLSFEFQSESFENPALQKHFHHLEAVALEREKVEDIEDLTQPNVDMIDRRAGDLIEEFNQIVFPGGQVDQGRKQKRKPSESASAGDPKRQKTSSEVESIAKEGRLDTLRVSDLKDYLKSVGVKASGRKQELIDQVKDHLGL